MSASQPSTYRLYVVALLAVLLAFDVIFVVAVYVLGHVALGLAPLVMYRFDALFWTMGFDLVPLEPVLIVGTPLVLVLQSVFGYRLTLREAREYDIGPDKELKNIVLADRSGDEKTDGLVGLLRKSAILNWLWDLADDDTNLSNFELPVLLFAPIALPILGAIFLASTACYRLLSRIREYAADAGGVAICGSPAALASALETLTGDPRPETDVRRADTGGRVRLRIVSCPDHILTPKRESRHYGTVKRISRVSDSTACIGLVVRGRCRGRQDRVIQLF
ncbi:MAG: hypothetical protein V5A34_07305 [Halapricum sp.]